MFKSDLYAAQLFYLRKPSKASTADMFAIVFQDLTLRRVLNLKRIDTYPTDRSKKTQKYFMFTRGVNFNGYEAQNFERSLIVPFEEYDQLQPKTLTNSALRKYSLPSSYVTDEIMTPLKAEGYISSIPLLGIKKLTQTGENIVNEINNYLTEKAQALTDCIEKDRETFITILKEMKTLTFFLKKDNEELYKSIIEGVKWVNQNKPLGFENDLSEFTEAINIDMSYLDQH